MPNTGARTLVAVDADTALPTTYRNARIVRTSLDLILALEDQPERVILLGAFAHERSFAAFVREISPASEVVTTAERTSEASPLQLCYA